MNTADMIRAVASSFGKSFEETYQVLDDAGFLEAVKSITKHRRLNNERQKRYNVNNVTRGVGGAVASSGLKALEPTALEPQILKAKKSSSGDDSLAVLWNENCGGLPKVRLPMRASRRTKVSARLREVPDLETWREAIRRVTRSRFCLGTNDRNWIADFEFLIRPDTLTKIQEGKYDNRDAPVNPAAGEMSERRKRQLERAEKELGFKIAECLPQNRAGNSGSNGSDAGAETPRAAARPPGKLEANDRRLGGQPQAHEQRDGSEGDGADEEFV